jgi:hypothetical protein
MKPDIKPRARLIYARAVRVSCVIALVLLSSYCTGPDKQQEIPSLNAEERYLVDAYLKVVEARDLHAVSYLKSDSLFTVLDSTIDTTRIANTIRKLNGEPDRWLVVFESIEKQLGYRQRELEDAR